MANVSFLAKVEGGRTRLLNVHCGIRLMGRAWAPRGLFLGWPASRTTLGPLVFFRMVGRASRVRPGGHRVSERRWSPRVKSGMRWRGGCSPRNGPHFTPARPMEFRRTGPVGSVTQVLGGSDHPAKPNLFFLERIGRAGRVHYFGALLLRLVSGGSGRVGSLG